jgi:4-hydroxybenzoate polyprenyltransferase
MSKGLSSAAPLDAATGGVVGSERPPSGAASGAAVAPLSVAGVLWVAVAPLVQRIGRGEGQLLAINFSIAFFAVHDLGALVAHGLVSTAVLTLLYGLNDVYDSARDVHDPGKNQAFVQLCLAHRRPLLAILAVEKVLVVALAALLLGPRSALAAAAVFAVNVLYSVFFKGRPAVDVFWVALWGALFGMVPGIEIPLSVLLMIGVMTSMSHVFQILRDRAIDQANHVRTSAVAAPWLPPVQMAACCAALGALLYGSLGVLGAASAVAPLLLSLGMRSNQTAWLTAKVYYGVIWLLVSSVTYGA